MKSIYISILLFVSIFSINAQIYTINQNQPIILTDGYVNSMSVTWNVESTIPDKPLLINYTIETEQRYDIVTFYSIDNSGNTTQLLQICGTQTGQLSTFIPTGKARITFTTDGSVCYANNPSIYSGLNISFAIDNSTIANNGLIVNGNAYVKGNIEIGETSKVKIMNFPGHSAWIDMPAEQGKASGIGSGGTGINTWIGFAGTAGNWFSNSNVGDICYRNLNGALLFGNSTGNAALRIQGGNVGIGTTTNYTPYKLDVNGQLRVRDNIYGMMMLTLQDDTRFTVTPSTVPELKNSFSMTHYGLAAPHAGGSADLWLAGNHGIHMFTNGNANPRLSISYTGNIGVNVSNPQYTLDVKGAIRATEVKIESVDNFPDYVFMENYPLRPLSEVSEFIKANGHLPEIPSVREVKEQGMSLVEMNKKLLQKIEELTLYIIDQQRQIDELKKRKE